MIEFQCTAGHRLRVKDDIGGKKIKCPKCGGITRVPTSSKKETPQSAKPMSATHPAAKKKKAPAAAPPESEWDDSEWDEIDEDENDTTFEEPTLPPRKAKKRTAAKAKPKQLEASASEAPLKQMAMICGGLLTLLIIGCTTLYWVWGRPSEPEIATNASAVTTTDPVPNPPTAAADQTATNKPRPPANQQSAASGKTAGSKPKQVASSSGNKASTNRNQHRPATKQKSDAAKSGSKTKGSIEEPVVGPIKYPDTKLILMNRRVVFQLDYSGPRTVEFAVVPQNGNPQAAVWREIQTLPPPSKDSQFYKVDAALSKGQRLAFISGRELARLKGRGLKPPFQIRLDSERMTVKSEDDFTTSLNLERPDPIAHMDNFRPRFGERGFYVVDGNDDAFYFDHGQPCIIGQYRYQDGTEGEREIHWIPNETHLGDKLVMFRWATGRSKTPRELNWKVTVTDQPIPGKSAPQFLAEQQPKSLPFAAWDRPQPIAVGAPIESPPLNADDETKIRKAMRPLQRTGDLIARYVPEGDRVKVQLAVQVKPDKMASVVVPFGTRIPLQEFKVRTEKFLTSPMQSILVDQQPTPYPQTNPLCRVRELKSLGPIPADQNDGDFGRSSIRQKPFYRKMLWAPDGESVFVLLAEQKGLIKIDTKTWEIVSHINPVMIIRDITLSSQGLVALTGVGLKDPGDGWVKITQKTTDIGSALAVFDLKTMRIVSVFQMTADLIAGRPNSDLIYIYRANRPASFGGGAGPQKDEVQFPIRVIDVANSALLSIESHTIPNRNAVFDHMMLTADAKSLIAYASGTGRRAGNTLCVARFSIDGPHVGFVQLEAIKADSGPQLVATGDGSLVCIGSRSGTQLLQTSDFSNYMYSLAGTTAHFAADSNTRSLLSQPKPMTVQLNQYLTKVNIPVSRPVTDIQAEPNGRGYLVATTHGMLWIEVLSKANYWSCEADTPEQIPVQQCDFEATVPEEPLKFEKVKYQDYLKVKKSSRVEGVVWAPDGSAFYTLSEGSLHPNPHSKVRCYSQYVRRFSIATRTETHRFESPSSASSDNKLHVCSNGVVLAAADRVFLLWFEDVSPIWQLNRKYASRISADISNSNVVAKCPGGIVYFDSGNGTVLGRSSQRDLQRSWPKSNLAKARGNFYEATLQAEPNTIKVKYGDEAIFRLQGRRFVGVSTQTTPPPGYQTPKKVYPSPTNPNIVVELTDGLTLTGL
ncbi:hypothetical protein OAH18_01000 [bacterium]|nr:hypothetical protein [bacterium]